MPKQNGFALREKLKTDEKLNIKYLPYLFFTTAKDQKSVIDAYSLSVQGFFIKRLRWKSWKKRSSLLWSTGEGVQHPMIFINDEIEFEPIPVFGINAAGNRESC